MTPLVVDRTRLILLSGDVDVGLADDLDDLLQRFLDSRSPDVEVDLSQVTFLGSTGLAFLARLRSVSQGRGGRVTLCGPSDRVRRLLELAGFDGAFTVRSLGYAGTGSTPAHPA
jgi:anti-anti-sigma factor